MMKSVMWSRCLHGRELVCGLLLSALMAAFASAANLNWDPGLTNTATGGGAGTWDLSGTNWFNGSTDVAWTDTTGTASTAVFGGGAGGAVTLGANLGAAGITLNASGYTINGGGNTLKLGGAASAIVDSGPLPPGTNTINAPISLVSGSQTWTIGSGSTLIDNGTLSGSVKITKAGVGGTLTLAGSNTGFSGGISTGPGILNINNANALGTSAGTFTITGNGTIIGNTSGGAITNAGNNPVALNASITFDLANDLNLGTGTVTFGATRTLAIKGGNLTLGPLAGGANTFVKTGGGTLTIDNAANAIGATAIEGGTVNLGTTGVMGGSGQSLTMLNGELKYAGTSAANRSQAVSSLVLNAVVSTLDGGGRSTITLAADPAKNTSFTAGTVTARGIDTTMLFRGTNLGTTSIASATAGTTNISFTTAPTPSATISAATLLGATGTGTPGTTQAAVFRGGLYDASAAGTGTGFATYDTTNGVRALNSSTEQATTYPGANSDDNVRLDLAGATAITGVQTNTLELKNTSGSAQVVTNTGTTLNPTNGLLFSGTSPITLTGGTFNYLGGGSASGSDAVIMSTNSAGVTINTTINQAGTTNPTDVVFGGPGNITVSAAITGVNTASTGGIYINGPGTVTLDGAMSVNTKGIVVMGGTAKLGPNFTQSSDRPFQVANGATLDMNGVSVANVQGIVERNIGGSNGSNSSSTNGGTITNTSGTTSTLTITRGNSANAQVSNASISGNINLVLNSISGGTAQTLTGQNTYTGSTTISSGTLNLGVTATNPVAASILPAGTALIINGGGASPSLLSLVSVNQTVGSLSGNSTGGGGTINSTTAGVGGVLTVNGGAGANYAGVLSGAAAGTLTFVKTGAGTQTLSGANTYTGVTLVNGGTLLVNGSHTGGGAYTVYAGGTLGGSGTINSSLSIVGGTLAPGNSPGTFTVNNTVSFDANSTLSYDLNGADNTVGSNVNDLLMGVTNLTLDGVLNVMETSANSFLSATAGEKWRLANYSGTLTNNGLNLGSMPALPAGLAFQIDTSTPNQINLMAVPEASAFMLVGLVAGGGLAVRRLCRRKQVSATLKG
jgi:fibronectin-binding autotransporter adhesin